MPDWDALQEVFFGLMYTVHGGSGLHGLAWPSILELDWAQVEWFAERLDTQRSAEAAALRGKPPKT